MDEKLEHIETIPVADFRKDVARFTDQAASMGKRIGITRHGRAIAAIVPISDVEVLESMDAAAFAEPERLAPEEKSSPEENLLENVWYVENENFQDEASICPVPSVIDAVSPGAAVFTVVADQLGSYLTGQIAARIADSHVLSDPDIFGSVQNIVARTINESFDSSILPNPPKGIFEPVVTVSSQNKAISD